ncbi:MAG: M24 family metallopeptidase, partial [Candidatus Adiutrix sp.]
MNNLVISMRLKNLRTLMGAHGVTALLITSAPNRRYYSGFLANDTMLNESSGVLLITESGQYLLTDCRYSEAAKKQAPLFKVLEYGQGLGAELAKLKQLKAAKTICFEPEFMTVGLLNRLSQAALNCELAPLPFNLDEPRAIKSSDEIKLIKKALAITEAAVSFAWERMEPGVTEQETAFLIEAEFRRLGAEGPSFETIVAAGPNAALPHAEPTGRKMKNGDMVIIDCGAKYKGYCADITRTKIIGPPKPW